MSATIVASSHVSLDLIDAGENIRELDLEHVDALAGSIELRGLIVPLPVRVNDKRFTLVAGYHRYAACCKLKMENVAVTLRQQEGSSADGAAENVVRKQLSPLEEARAVAHMLAEGYTLDGAATILGWSTALVNARAKILELPEPAQQVIGSGKIPVSATEALLRINAVSGALCEHVASRIDSGAFSGGDFARQPGWAVRRLAKEGTSKVFAAVMSDVSKYAIADLRLGKKSDALYAKVGDLYKALVPHSYESPSIRFSQAAIDRARAAGVLIEFDDGAPIITDRALYRDLLKDAIKQTFQELDAEKKARDAERAKARASSKLTPRQELDAEHRATMRSLTARLHNTNIDLGSGLLKSLANVDPSDMNVARFFAYGLLGPEHDGSFGHRDSVAWSIAANGIRLVIEEHRTTTRRVLKNGRPGKTKVTYGDIKDAQKWLWKFIEGAKTAGELYGRTLVVFAAQHYANDLVLPSSKRRSTIVPRSRQGTAGKAFERITKKVLPASHAQLCKAIEQEAEGYVERALKLDTEAHRNATQAATAQATPEAEPQEGEQAGAEDDDLALAA